MKKTNQTNRSSLSWKHIALAAACTFMASSASAVMFDISLNYDSVNQSVDACWTARSISSTSTTNVTPYGVDIAVAMNFSDHDNVLALASTNTNYTTIYQDTVFNETDALLVAACFDHLREDYVSFSDATDVSFFQLNATDSATFGYFYDVQYAGAVGGTFTYTVDNISESDWAEVKTETTALTALSLVNTVSIPEPATFGLLGLSALGVIGYHRAKKMRL